MLRKTLLSFFALFMMAISTHAQQWPGVKDSIYSKAIGETRKFQVILPADYNKNSNSRYEVLYMPDGEWYMELVPSIYRFVASANFAPENIFVLIPNTYVNGVNIRNRDYSPTKITEDSISGGADNYHRFLKEELIPYVEKKYRSTGQRTLVGSSFSGLFAIYSFFKDPELFQSFVASDPNLLYGDHFVTKLAQQKLPTFTNVKSTLFFAGLTISQDMMGSKKLDSLLSASAPKSLHWKYIAYPDETHYSVQHKAFYDGMRFSHLGYSKEQLQFHPMNGVIEPNKPISIFLTRNNDAARFTVDGSTPLASSKELKTGELISGPGTVTAMTFPNRMTDARTSKGVFTNGPVPTPKKISKPKPITCALYDGTWNELSDVSKVKPTTFVPVKEKFLISSMRSKNDAIYLLRGSLTVEADGYYIFATNVRDRGKISVNDQTLIDSKDAWPEIMQSYVVPLRKGQYDLKAEFLKKSKSPEFVFMVFHTTPEKSNWWENPVMQY